MAKVYSETKPAAIIMSSSRQVWQIAVTGLIVGLLVWGVAWLFQTYLYSIVLCRGDLVAKCASAPQYATATAAVIATGIGLFALARLQVFRPLPVVLAAVISLWGMTTLTTAMPWFGAAIAIALLYAVAYALFSWVARIRSFLLAVLLMTVLVVIVRLTIAG